MESLGQIFRAAREKHGYSVKEIAEETKIGSRYLNALEEDSFTVFPSQTHITGFIRSYAKYLDLDPERMIDIYKRILIQEAPTPIEELTTPHKQKQSLSTFVVIIVILAALLFTFILITNLQKRPNAAPDNEKTDAEITQNEERIFMTGDFIPITLNGEGKRVVFEDIAPETVTVRYDDERSLLAVGRPHILDLDHDGEDDIRIHIASVSGQRAYGSAALLREELSPLQGETAVNRTIGKYEEQTDIRLSITANGIATVNTVCDNQEKNEYFLKKGQTITVLAKDTLQLTASNPHNLLLNLNGSALEMDTQGPAAGFVFKWRHSPADGLYHLEYEHLR